MNNYFFHMEDGTIFQVKGNSAEDAWNNLRKSELFRESDKVLTVHIGEIIKRDGMFDEIVMLEKVWLADAIN